MILKSTCFSGMICVLCLSESLSEYIDKQAYMSATSLSGVTPDDLVADMCSDSTRTEICGQQLEAHPRAHQREEIVMPDSHLMAQVTDQPLNAAQKEQKFPTPGGYRTVGSSSSRRRAVGSRCTPAALSEREFPSNRRRASGSHTGYESVPMARSPSWDRMGLPQ